MTKFCFNNLPSIRSAFCAICAIILLQACGGERTTPFQPQLSSSSCSSSSSSSSSSSLDIIDLDSSSSSSSSSSCSSSSSSSSSSSLSSSSSSNSSSASASSVAHSLLWSGNQTNSVIDKKEKNVQIIRTSEGFHSLANAYVNQNLEEPNFERGQVILVDDGEIDSCAAHLEFTSTLSATELSNNTVRVALRYVEKPKLEKCSSSFSRPFYFYYLNTRKEVVIEEKLN